MDKIFNKLVLTVRNRANRVPDGVKTLVLILLATLAAALFNHLSRAPGNVYLIYILAVVIVSSLTDRYFWGVVSCAAGVIGVNYFFTYPYFAIDFTLSGYPLTFALMLGVSVITSALTSQVKQQARQSIHRENRTSQLYEIAKKLLATRGLENIVSLSRDFLGSQFNCNVEFYLDDPYDDKGEVPIPVLDAPELSGTDEKAASLSFDNQVASGCGAGTNASADRLYLPIYSQGISYGVVGLSTPDGSPLEEPDMAFLEMIISQIAMALERQRLSDDQRRISVEAEKEKMRSNLLRAISHDLRTPLTGILGASSTILESKNKLSQEVHDKLVTDIREDSQWLIRMVENLLSVTRMKDGETSVSKLPEAVEEIAAEAISRIRLRFPEQKINVRVPDDLLMVPMDGTLIEQVIINLVENSIKHSGRKLPIEIVVRSENQYAVFEISDDGDGIAPAELPYVFDGYATARGTLSSDSSRGMGIGLSICNSIVKAHGGSITAENKESGGAKFVFRLPLQEDVQ